MKSIGPLTALLIVKVVRREVRDKNEKRYWWKDAAGSIRYERFKEVSNDD